jgi:5'-nucleotidase
MRARPVRQSVLGIALCAATLFGSACFGGQSPPQPTATTGGPPLSPAPALASPSPLAAPSPSPTATRASGPEQTYTVEAGDTLGTISQKFYGDPTLWRKIYDANRSAIGDDPDAIKVGTQLRIPPKD